MSMLGTKRRNAQEASRVGYRDDDERGSEGGTHLPYSSRKTFLSVAFMPS
jgi:hypothetical protein